MLYVHSPIRWYWQGIQQSTFIICLIIIIIVSVVPPFLMLTRLSNGKAHGAGWKRRGGLGSWKCVKMALCENWVHIPKEDHHLSHWNGLKWHVLWVSRYFSIHKSYRGMGQSYHPLKWMMQYPQMAPGNPPSLQVGLGSVVPMLATNMQPVHQGA